MKFWFYNYYVFDPISDFVFTHKMKYSEPQKCIFYLEMVFQGHENDVTGTSTKLCRIVFLLQKLLFCLPNDISEPTKLCS